MARAAWFSVIFVVQGGNLLVSSADGVFDDGKEALDRAQVVRAEKAARDATLSALADRHARLMYRIAFSVLRNAQDSEDAVQEVFLKLYRRATTHEIKDEKAFLARAVWRVALDRLPKVRQISINAAYEQLAGREDSPDAKVIRRETAEYLRKLVDALPSALRQPLILCAIKELNSREVGLLLDLPEGTVRTRLKQAREELRKRYHSAERSGK